MPEEACKSLLLKLRDVLGINEALIFSTCNRTEVYYVAEENFTESIIQVIGIENGIDQPLQYLPYFREIEGMAAVEYLFQVSMGLQSNVLGDLQIAGQVKNAYLWAHEAKMAGAFIHRMMHTIFHTNKRVHQETAYRDGAASVSYAAAELAVELTTHLQRPSVLVLGLGEMGRDVARNLELDRFARVAFCNRTQSKAEALAAELGAMVLPIEQLEVRAHEFDVIIASPSVAQPIILPEMLHANSARSKFLIDLSVPRSIAREVESLPNAILYNIDEIQTRTEQVLDRRREAIPQVHSIIQEEVRGFENWAMELTISPTIQKMKDALEQIRKEELGRFLKNATEREAELLENATRNIVNKFLKMPVLQLKEACKRGEQENLIEVLHDIFNLEARKERV